ncbi:FkbM family methyltransferase [Tabrizicola oligotrophica]|uniref:FkbM family methyltransferase n=1 Tax=Tabrizicola oligotrophica TaxID=2710650 RepID=A0A6M0QPJ2_9RHOB|nr:FkbM family methyltransferase [Tabrizicola oligotrophica]NEY89031.1 FkbM family methyltransferase [Tabrizicola oligotrophica]
MKERRQKNALLARHAAAAVARPDLVVSPAGQVVRAEIAGQAVFFTLTNPRDVIQKEHLAGRFYEPEELEIIRAHCPQAAVFVDIGANIGNHALFALKMLGVRKVIPFEPNPVALAVLRSNLGLNGELGRCDLAHLGLGLSDRAQGGLAMEVDKPNKNLGGGRLVEGGELRVIRGDDALAPEAVDFIKIDVEGMEMQVLRGLSQTITRCRPVIFIEVDEANRAEFLAWVAVSGYAIADTFRRYPVNENFLIKPASAGRPA